MTLPTKRGVESDIADLRASGGDNTSVCWFGYRDSETGEYFDEDRNKIPESDLEDHFRVVLAWECAPWIDE